MKKALIIVSIILLASLVVNVILLSPIKNTNMPPKPDTKSNYDTIKVLQSKIDSLNNIKKTIIKKDTIYLDYINYIKDKTSKDTSNVSKLSNIQSKDTFYFIYGNPLLFNNK